MDKLENDILSKLEITELKKEVITILHSLQFDEMYKTSECIMDLHKMVNTLDQLEIPHSEILNNNSVKLEKETICIY